MILFSGVVWLSRGTGLQSRSISTTLAHRERTSLKLQREIVTTPFIIVNIAKPPTGKLSLFNLYIALSWSSGHQTIHILRDFDEQIFRSPHDEFLLKEDERLEQ